MDDAHVMAAVRYIENNPEAAGLVTRAEDWVWSSARAHIAQQSEGLTDVATIGRHIYNWRATLADGLEAADADLPTLRTGRPCGEAAWCDALAVEQEWDLATPRKVGRPRKTELKNSR